MMFVASEWMPHVESASCCRFAKVIICIIYPEEVLLHRRLMTRNNASANQKILNGLNGSANLLKTRKDGVLNRVDLISRIPIEIGMFQNFRHCFM